MPEGAFIVLIGTKIDLPKRKVSTEEAASFAKEHKMEYFEISVKDASAEEVEAMFTTITQHLLDAIHVAHEVFPLVRRCIQSSYID
jgi:hypothetical protein